MNIAILGFGTVGSGVYDIIKNSSSALMGNIHISKILVRSIDKYEQNGLLTTSFDEIIEDSSIELIVEAIGGIHPAYEYISKALNAKKHVVTANKAVLAEYFTELILASKSNNTSLMFEASVGGGIPIIQSIFKAKRIDSIQEISGILNGTSNFILNNMYKYGYKFNRALGLAQENGYAELNPSADIDGIDIQRKLAIVSSLCFDCNINYKAIYTFGISNITDDDIQYFKNNSLVIKLYAKALVYNKHYTGCVEPVLFSNDELEANVASNYNICTIVGDSIGDLKLYGQGAGKFPTANAVVQDIIDIMLNSTQLKTIQFSNKLIYDLSLISGKYYIRFTNSTAIKLFNDYIDTSFLLNNQACIITKEIALEKFSSIINKALLLDNKLFYARYRV